MPELNQDDVTRLKLVDHLGPQPFGSIGPTAPPAQGTVRDPEFAGIDSLVEEVSPTPQSACSCVGAVLDGGVTHEKNRPSRALYRFLTLNRSKCEAFHQDQRLEEMNNGTHDDPIFQKDVTTLLISTFNSMARNIPAIALARR